MSEKLPWRIEYEVFPIRAIYTAYAHGDYSDEQCRQIFRDRFPHASIRSLARIQEPIDSLDIQPPQP